MRIAVNVHVKSLSKVRFFPKSVLVVVKQVGASMMEPNHFLMIVLNRFELFHIFSSADCRKRYREANKVSADSAFSPLTSQKLELHIFTITV